MSRSAPEPRSDALPRTPPSKASLQFLGGTCGLLGDSCVRPEPPRCDADEALEVTAEGALVREAGARRDLCQGEVAFAQELLRPLDATQDDVLVRRQSGGGLELPREVVGVEADNRSQLRQGRADVEVFLDVLDDGAEHRSGERAVPPAPGLAGRQDMSDQVDCQDVGQRLGGGAAALLMTSPRARGAARRCVRAGRVAEVNRGGRLCRAGACHAIVNTA
jgi:hypothetical protein